MNIMQKNSFVKRLLNKFDIDENKARKYKGFIKHSWAITWPMLMILLFQFFMNMTDVVIAGMKGASVQAAIGMANQTYIILTVVITAITTGTIAVLSRIYGSPGRAEKLPGAIYTAVVFAIICSVVVTVIAFVFAPAVLAKMKLEASVKAQSILFIKLYCIGIFFNLVMLHFNGIMRACGLIAFSMKLMVGISILNIILSIVLAFHTPLGASGIALATSICWITAFFIAFPVIRILMRTEGKNKFDKAVAKKIFHIGWPAGIVSASWQLSSAMMYAMVGALPLYSVETMAAMTAGLRIESMIYMPAFAFNMANAVMVGNLLGEDRKDDAFSIGLTTVIVGVTLITLITVAVIAMANPIAHFIAAKDATGAVNPIALQETIRYLRVVMISEPFMAANLMFSGALSGAGDTRALMRYSLFSLWVLRIPTAYFFGLHMGYGAIAIWWAMNITFFCQSFLSGRRFFSRKWSKDC